MTWLMGTYHNIRWLEHVTKRLDCEELTNKNLMIEAYSFPVVEERYSLDQGSINFWNNLATYVHTRGGKIILGEDKELYFQAREERKQANIKINNQWKEAHNSLPKDFYWSESEEKRAKEKWRSGKIEAEKKEKELRQKIDYIYPHEKRDPHFKKVIEDENPDIVILGCNHIPYLVDNLNREKISRITYTPSDIFSNPKFLSVSNIPPERFTYHKTLEDINYYELDYS